MNSWDQALESVYSIGSGDSGSVRLSRSVYLSPHDALEPFPFARNQLCSSLSRIFDGEPDPLHLKMQLPLAAFSTVNRIHFT